MSDQNFQRVLTAAGATAHNLGPMMTRPAWAVGALVRVNITAGAVLSLQPRVNAIGPDGTVIPILTVNTALTGVGTAVYWLGDSLYGAGTGTNLTANIGCPWARSCAVEMRHGNATACDYTVDVIWV